jgi:Uncharacterised nucleotidyltransferase
MTDIRRKRVVLAALSFKPEFSGLTTLPDLNSRPGRHLLNWLDRSGLALALLGRLRRERATEYLPEEWKSTLERRLERNVERTRDILEEAERLEEAFRSFRVTAATIKGITLCPDFCDDPYFRHQVDFDFLVAAESVDAAAEVFGHCGYSAGRLSHSGETCFLTPLRHIPSAGDDLYVIQRQRQVDLHVSIWEPCVWLPVETPSDCLERAVEQSTSGVRHLGLTLEDKFLLQVLHVFRHSFRSWVRVSWLYEIAHCSSRHAADDSLWSRVMERAGSSHLMRRIFAFVLGLTQRLFESPIPEPFRPWIGAAMTPSLRAWLDHFGVDWATSDWPGNLSNLFLTAEFIVDARLRKQYWRSRLLPRKAQTSLGAVAAASPAKFFRLQAARARYVAQRAAAHLKDIAALPWQQLRWRRVVSSSRGTI